MTPALAYACPRCRGVLVRDDDGEWVCLLCARALNPPETLPKVAGDGDARREAWHSTTPAHRRYRKRS